MRLVVGIGNPGKRYEGTRHNVGFDAVEAIAARHGAEFRKEKYWNSLRARCRLGDRDVSLLKPLSYVNLTGPVVRKVGADLSIEVPDMLVVLDDFWLPLGRIRLRRKGGAGGHNGMDSIVRAMGAEVPRLRIGIGRPEEREAVDHVLSRFRVEERDVVDVAIGRAADAVELWASEGIEAAMNAYNPEE